LISPESLIRFKVCTQSPAAFADIGNQSSAQTNNKFLKGMVIPI